MGERYEELEALKAIFGEDLKEINQVVKKKNNKKKKEQVLEISLCPFSESTGNNNDNNIVVSLEFRLGPKYPTGEAPQLTLKEVQGKLPLSQRKRKKLYKDIAQVPHRYKGRVCIYDTVEFVRERIVEYCRCYGTAATTDDKESVAFDDNRSNTSGSSCGRETSEQGWKDVNAKEWLEKQEEERRAEEEYAMERNARKRMPDNELGLDAFLRSDSCVVERSLPQASSCGLAPLPNRKNSIHEASVSVSDEWNDDVVSEHFSEEFLIAGEKEEQDCDMNREELFIRHLLRSLLYTNGWNLGDKDMNLSNIEILEEIFGDIRLDDLNNSSEVEAFRRIFWNHMRKASKKKGIENMFWSILMNTSIMRRQQLTTNRFRPLLSRYREDFEFLRLLGRGGFGSVMKVRNKLDGRIYALKRVALTEKLLQERHILREVTTLSRLSHPHVVRYHHAWLENEEDRAEEEGSLETPKVVAYLYIQMEYCRRTLREFIDHVLDKNEDLWSLFRQIVEGLHHIHQCGILHRDLKPTNIFFDAQGTIKIGDFGLAKEIVTQEGVLSSSEKVYGDQVSLNDSIGTDRTGGVGTLYYRAPELEENEFPTYDSKVDIYSLGIIAFELWHGPFETAMERHEVLMALRATASPDEDFQRRLQRQSRLVRSLLQKDPKKRPTAAQILDGDYLPPKVEDEYVSQVMRRIGDPVSHLYMKALSTLFEAAPCWNPTSGFNEESLFLFPNNQNSHQHPKYFVENSSFHLCYSQVLDHLENSFRSIFQKYGAVPFQHNVSSFQTDANNYGCSSESFHPSLQLLLRSGKKISLCSTWRRHMLGEYLSLGRNVRLFEFGEVWDYEEDGFWDDWYHYQSDMFRGNVKDIRSYRVAEFNAFYSSPLVVLDAELLFLVAELCQPIRSHYGNSVAIRLGHADLLPAILTHCGLFQIFQPSQVSKQLIHVISFILSCSFYRGSPQWIKGELMAVLSSENMMIAYSHQRRLVQRTVEKLCNFASLRGSPRTVVAKLMRLLEPLPGQPFVTCPKLSAFIQMERRSTHSHGSSSSSNRVMKQHAGAERKQQDSQQSLEETAMIYAPAAKALEYLVDVLSILDKTAAFPSELLVLDPVLYKRADCFHGILLEVATRKTTTNSASSFVAYGGSWREPISEDAIDACCDMHCHSSQGQQQQQQQKEQRVDDGTNLHVEKQQHHWVHSLGVTFCLEKLAKQICKESVWMKTPCDVFVMSMGGDGLLEMRFAIVCELRASNMKAEFLPVVNPSLHEQMTAAKSCGAKWMVLVRNHLLVDSRREDATNSGDVVLKVKSFNGKIETEVSRKQLISYLSSVIVKE
ncbi:hypothetical protein GAYE_SCF34G4994 [Galdieria yellowstonensis]|uniref:non-specific serine/threonine protein kinase n=1 Tax=Galdieria yellowstonensis TaxID=3028027 RepID=A0AAV9II52_9RHOD|nr:hypothetical protein GAYE_SCF34G4994 [Galdieria yellowstonensis]